MQAFVAFRAGAAAALAKVFSAAVWFALFLVAGAGLVLAGIFMMLGLGWTLFVGGVLCMVAAALVLVGMTRAG